MPVNKTATTSGESGFTLIDLLFTASLICTVCTMALPSLLRARGVAQSASAIATLRVINSAQLSFAVTCGSGFYSPTFPTLGVAPPSSSTAFLPPELTSGASFVKQGYTFSMGGTALPGAPASCNGLARGRRRAGLFGVCGSARCRGQSALLCDECGRHDLSARLVHGRHHARIGAARDRHASQVNVEIWQFKCPDFHIPSVSLHLIPYGPPEGEDSCLCADFAR